MKSFKLKAGDSKKEIQRFVNCFHSERFSEFGFKRIFERVDIELHGMESPVYTPVGEGKKGNDSLAILVIVTLSSDPSLSITVLGSILLKMPKSYKLFLTVKVSNCNI